MDQAKLDRVRSLSKKWLSLGFHNIRPSAFYGRIISPKILMNSIPKAGTNLLEQALVNFPYLRRSGFRTLRGWDKVDTKTMKAIGNLGRGGVMLGHLPAHKNLLDVISENNIKVLLMVRDPRDLIVSYVKYVTYIDRTHPAHSYFKALPDDDMRLMAVINGVDDIVSPISETLEKFSGWLTNDETMVVRFEDIIGSKGGGSDNKQQQLVSQVAVFLNIHISGTRLQYICENIFNPGAITFRKSQIGGWRSVLKEKHIFALDEKAGSFIEKYGYTN